MSAQFVYLICIVAFILSVRLMSSPRSAVIGSYIGMAGMAVAILFAFSRQTEISYPLIIALTFGAVIGVISGIKIKITALPQMIAAFNGLGGGAAVCIAAGEISAAENISTALPLGAAIGAITFSGSLIAFCKLQGVLSGHSRRLPLSAFFNIIFAAAIIIISFYLYYFPTPFSFYILTGLALLWGIWLIWPVGGADMPIAVSLLNSFSGWASVAIGFTQNNTLMIAVGTIVGASGSILAYIMTKAMNTSLLGIFYPHIKDTQTGITTGINRTAQTGSPSDAAFIMENAQKVIIVPGFGMAAASAQHAVKTMGDLLRNKYHADVKYAIHPVAGRMPGHMNVLLAEANVDYDAVYELEDINREFATTDVAYVIGANDITNPEAKNNPDSPLYGMPILDVGLAKTVFFVKRSLGSGYSGIDNPLFFAPNTIMLYGDAKKITEEIDKALEQ
uniref:NAD(P) transhydrogenase subunit beta n=1 Tax=uncultured Alphaproteobacteria bacterium TaxID=91750 RepID=A0A6M4NNI2_9PROT|nr:NAD(P) transhydrogenase subunit beta [uncultured Alphaproteobacteria bacterium]